jgi:hypothetical protein
MGTNNATKKMIINLKELKIFSQKSLENYKKKKEKKLEQLTQTVEDSSNCGLLKLKLLNQNITSNTGHDYKEPEGQIRYS